MAIFALKRRYRSASVRDVCPSARAERQRLTSTRLTKKLATEAIPVDGLASGQSILKAVDVGLHDLVIAIDAEDQRDIDIDAAADQLANGREVLRGCRHLDHQIWPVHQVVEPFGFGNGGLGVIGKIGRHFQADETILAAGVCRPVAGYRPRSECRLMASDS